MLDRGKPLYQALANFRRDPCRKVFPPRSVPGGKGDVFCFSNSGKTVKKGMPNMDRCHDTADSEELSKCRRGRAPTPSERSKWRTPREMTTV